MDATAIGAGMIELQAEEELRLLHEELRLLDEIRQENWILTFVPNPTQAKIISSDAYIRCLFGGNKVGKSTIGDSEDVSFCLGYRPYLPEHHPRFRTPFKPPIEVMVFGETWDKIDEIHTPKFEQLIPAGEAVPIKKQGHMKGWKFRNGSIIRYATYEMDPKRFEGADKHLYHFDEPPPYSIFAPVTRGTVVHGGMILLTLTLLSEGWIWDEIWEKAAAGNPDYFAVVGDIRDNVYDPETGAGALSEKFIARFEGTLSDFEREVRIHGKPQHLQGRIFKQFQVRKPWVIPAFDVPDDWPAIRSFDPHLQKPHGGLWVRVAPSGRVFVTDELFDSSIMGMDGIREAVTRIERARRHNPALSLMDEAAAGPGNIVESESVIDIYKRYGIHCRPCPRADRLTQIMNMAELFKVDPFTQQPGIVIFENCQHLIWEIKRFVHPTLRNAAGLNRFKPLPEGRDKKDDDLIDCLKNIIARKPTYEGLQPSQMAYARPPDGQVGATFAEEYGTNWAGNGNEEWDDGLPYQSYA